MPRRMLTWCLSYVARSDPQVPRPLLARSCTEVSGRLGAAQTANSQTPEAASGDGVLVRVSCHVLASDANSNH